MHDSLAFPTPDEYPSLTELIALCEQISKITTIGPEVLSEDLRSLKRLLVDTLTSGVCDPTPNDEVLHMERDSFDRVRSVNKISRETWINLLAMESMDERDNGADGKNI